jgi:uncharacterized protein (TIGR03435 family)
MKLGASLFTLTILAAAQTPAPTKPEAPIEFDVASIKLNKSGSGSSGVHQSNGLWRGNNNTVKSLIVNAYDILPDQISSAPAWIDAERYDIDAKYDRDPAISGAEDSKQTKLRLQALLKSRFQLEVHRQTKEWQAYALLGGKKGPKLTPTERKEGSSINSNNGHMVCQGVSMDGLARSLAATLGRPVANETGLEGRFDFTLDYEPEGRIRLTDDSKSVTTNLDARGPSLFTALQDQIGLKLESKKVPVEMLIVDRIERPSDN